MGATLNTLALLTQDRLEETADGVGVFWSVKNEIRPLLVEACNEATLISGLPQIRASEPFTLTANTRLFTLPSPAFVLARMDGAGVIGKTSFWSLDQDHNTWEQETGPLPKRWFPFGVGQFGIWPLLTASVTVYLTTINFPVSDSRPYSGTETIPFSLEFQEGIVNSAAAIARLKEGGKDMIEGLKFYEMFLTKMVELSKFGDRISKLRFTRSQGIPAQGSDTEVR